ncbi:hypothetical protein D9M73_257720 [compost metagenome]
MRGGDLHDEARPEQFAHERLEQDVDDKILFEEIPCPARRFYQLPRLLPDRILQPVALASIDVEFGQVERDLAR